MTATPAPTAGAGLTDDRLGGIIRYIARLCLEAERGLRSPDQLRDLMDPRTAHLWQPDRTLGRFHPRPVLPTDIGHVRISRLSDTHVLATIVTRTDADRWAAITLRLRHRRGRWMLTDLQRLQSNRHYTTPPAEPHGDDIVMPRPGRLEQAAHERRLVHAALHPTSQRLAELPPTDPGHAPTADLVRTWRATLDDLDRELDHLRTRQATRRTDHPPLRR